MSTLFDAVGQFSALTQGFSDSDLNRPWGWREYDEGIRFAFFRIYEELCQLAARLESAAPDSTARRILSQYHVAYRELQAVLLGVSDDLAAQPPAEGEWPAREALAHIVQAERGFFTTNHFGLQHLRQGLADPFEMTEEIWNNFWADAPFAELSERGALSEILAYQARLHPRILAAFADVSADELRAPIKFWESELLPLEFRLHRFTSHLRQHTIQIEKTLAALGRSPTEAARLLRLIYAALGAAEGATLGAEDSDAAVRVVASEIEHLTGKVAQAYCAVQSG
jgi:hypothetical protein